MSFFPSGIQVLDTPDQQIKIIPASRRPDGSVRKERKVREGYTPAEDVQVYQNRKAVDSKLPEDYVVGLGIIPKKTENLAEMSKSAKKNAKRAQKKRQPKPDKEEPKDEVKVEDLAEIRRRRLKQLRKLIKDCNGIKDRIEVEGEAGLLPEQIKKVERLPSLQEEFEKLSLEDKE
jgi:partner of Y14 and mago protein